jgi:hypothetical protein
MKPIGMKHRGGPLPNHQDCAICLDEKPPARIRETVRVKAEIDEQLDSGECDCEHCEWVVPTDH